MNLNVTKIHQMIKEISVNHNNHIHHKKNHKTNKMINPTNHQIISQIIK